MVFLHGGPGGASNREMSRIFDPSRYRLILFDQRGCGKSTPSAADENPKVALARNTTDDLIGDIQKIRAELNIADKMHLFGGSWGSTLALAYGIQHPETVKTLILRGIFLCRRKDFDYFYQGNAALHEGRPNDTSLPGAYIFFPREWRDFVEIIPASERGDMVKAYSKIFAMNPRSDEERAHQLAAAKAWSFWEGITSYLKQEEDDLGKYANPEFAKAFARIENHYFMNGAFLGGSGEKNRDNNYILEHTDRISSIPTYIVQGRYDQVCPMFQAEELIDALRRSGAKSINYTLTAAGHSMFEYENALSLTDIMDSLRA